MIHGKKPEMKNVLDKFKIQTLEFSLTFLDKENEISDRINFNTRVCYNFVFL